MIALRRGRAVRRPGLRRLAPLLAVLAGCATAGPAAAPPAGPGPAPASPAPLAAYVLLSEAPDGAPVAFARAIVGAGKPCPDLHGTGPQRRRTTAPLPMSKRANPHGFEVDVCEATVPFGAALMLGEGGPALPVARREVRRVAVVGDTGCKPKDQDGCGLDDPAWPFAALASAAAARRPDLVLHVGDYNYRGTPSSFEREVGGEKVTTWYYDAGDGAPPAERCGTPGPYYSQNSTGNPDADRWEAWWLDLFQPAADLLAAAPWVFTRGHHELCSHAGPGWFYFLDPSSALPEGGGEQLACPPQDGADGPALPHLAFAPPRVVALDGVTVAALDSANACDELPNFTATYAGQLAAVADRLDGSAAWLVGHRPVWGVEGTAEGPPYGCDGRPGTGAAQPYAALNVTLQCALAGRVGAALLPRLDLVLSGHMHRFETLSFAAGSGRPPTLVVGNSGVLQDTAPPQGAFEQTVDGAEASGVSVEQFGFVELDRGDRGAWRATVMATDPGAWSPAVPPCPAPGGERPFLCVEGIAARPGG